MNIEPWHTLVVTGAHYHEDKGCPGHTHPDGDTCDNDIDHELQHPDSCPPRRPCCCPSPPPSPLALALLCTACLEGAHEDCVRMPSFRCLAECQVSEYYSEHELPVVPGTYRVRMSTSRSYWTGEYDLDVEVEDVDVPPEPTAPATCPGGPDA